MKEKEDLEEQKSLLDYLKRNVSAGTVSSDDIAKMITYLQRAEKRIKKKEILREQQRKLEQEERERREEEERKRLHVQEITCMDLPLDWNNIFNSDPRTQGIHTDSVSDALILSLTTLGRVDIEYISSITGYDYKSVICTLKGSIYQNPETWNECFYQGWETADEYLSGNLMRKWKVADEANKTYYGYFSDNITAIEKVLPPSVSTKDIYVTLGSPWVPPIIIDDFMLFLFGDPFENQYFPNKAVKKACLEEYKTIHDEITGTWEIPYKSRYDHSVAVQKTYGTSRMEALDILEKTLNMKTISVTKLVRVGRSWDTTRVVDKGETITALEKQKDLINAFQEWVWSDEERKKYLESIYESNFSSVRRRIFDGSFLNFPTLSPSIKLYPYQKDAVARIIFTPNTLLAHDVGAGKTYVMIAAGQELLRMDLSKKNMYVVPNNIVGQWKNIFSLMYPSAKLLCVDPKNFTPAKRKSVLESMRDEDFDSIIIAYSCFEQIPLSREFYIEELKEKEEQVRNLLAQEDKATSRLRKKRDEIKKALYSLSVNNGPIDDNIYFDDLGITRLFVDEAHNFKNVPIETKTTLILGINSAGSKKCKDMLDKIHLIQKNNAGKGVVLATGTPIANSITDAFVMQQYLQSGELALLNLQNFDSWIGMFAERVTEFEIDVDTSSYRLATRFSKFHNLPELTALLSSIADFHQIDESAEIPTHNGYIDALISRTSDFAAYLSDISRRAEAVRQGKSKSRDDNMLKITTDGRKAALDLRLVDSSATFTYQSKVARCAENVANIYFQTDENKSTQLIFCDTSTPKVGFNMYGELKTRLIMLDVPENQIAFIHDAATEAQREKLFANMRNGDVRILIGSTFKLGLGVNIQDKLIALHHLDVPWRPADMTQREGRILRQGNTNPQVYIYRYITDGSFDAYSWQLLETKQRFIASLLSGSLTNRSGSDIEDTVLNYAEVKALAVGNPLIKERVEVANELSRYMALQRKLVENHIQMEKELLEYPGKIQNQKENIQNCEADLRFYDDWRKAAALEAATKTKKDETENRKKLRELINISVKSYILESKEKILMNYCGFDIVLPANMKKESSYIWLVRQGKYYVELGDTDIGNLIRIDHCLDTLDERIKKMQANLSKLQTKENEIKAELSKEESFSEKIESYKKKLDALDKQLGVYE